EDPEGARPCFRLLRAIRDDLRARGFGPLRELSMGMSGDLEVAIEEGATIVRVGTAAFGARAPASRRSVRLVLRPAPRADLPEDCRALLGIEQGTNRVEDRLLLRREMGVEGPHECAGHLAEPWAVGIQVRGPLRARGADLHGPAERLDVAVVLLPQAPERRIHRGVLAGKPRQYALLLVRYEQGQGHREI